MGETDDRIFGTSYSRRRFLQRAGAAGLAGMAAPMLGGAPAGAASRAATRHVGAPAESPLRGAPMFGATVIPPEPSDAESTLSAFEDWANLVYPIGVVKVFFGPGEYPIEPTHAISACITLGAQVILCYRPTFSGSSGPGGNKPSRDILTRDRAAMIASITNLRQKGADVAAVTLHSEPTGAGVAADQYNYLYEWNYAELHALAPVACCQSGGAADQVASYFPGPTRANPSAQLYTDGLTVDYYGGNHTSGDKPLSLWTSVANFAGVAFGIWESGDSATGGPALSRHDFTGYINAMQTVFQDRVNNGRPNMQYLWYQNNGGSGPDRILDKSDFRIPVLQGFQNSFSGG